VLACWGRCSIPEVFGAIDRRVEENRDDQRNILV